ncbi:hypothetical protein FKM82_030634 [Ascaphus truei]
MTCPQCSKQGFDYALYSPGKHTFPQALTYSSSHQSQHYAGKIPAFQHPVKLFWPKSQCYDFLYQEAEVLLSNFPVQATISFYQESDSDSETDSEEDEISDETQTT